MIDFHSHILPNIDDGASDEQEALNIIKEAKEAGFTKIISTSHYIEKYYETPEKQRTEVLQEILKKTERKQNLQNLYLGSEIYITDKIIELIKQGKASTINNTKYVLIELPMNIKSLHAKDIIFHLMENGYIPVIAHPERYLYVQKDINYVQELAQMGALFQANYGSLIGLYGSKAKKTVKKLLKKDLIQFMGSDVHRENRIYPQIPLILKKLKKIVTDEKIQEITELNAQKVLNNEII